MTSWFFIIATSLYIYLLLTPGVKSEKPVVSSEGKDRIVTAIEDNSDKTSTIPLIKKYSCGSNSCMLDFSLMDIKAENIDVEVGLLEIHLVTFESKGKAAKGHWYGESGFSYLSLQKKGTGPNENDLWFGILYDHEDNIYYDISPDASGTLILLHARLGSDIQPDLYIEPDNYSMLLTTTANASKAGVQTTLADDGSVIDILMVWTSGAECRASNLANDCTLTSATEANIRGKIASMISLSNQVYTNSGISTKLNLVYAYRDLTYKWDYQNDCTQAIYHLTDPNDGQMDDVHQKRSDYKADMVQLITIPCSYCGIAWVAILPLKEYAFSVITTNCMDLSSPHELGHNMGCYHDRGTDNKCSDVGFNFGYRNPTHSFRDVMAYDCISAYCKCNFNCGTSGCTRAPYISNIVSLYNTFPIGNDQNNCARTINENRQLIASFFQSTNAPAGKPFQPRAPNLVPAKKPKAPAGQPAQPRAPNLVPAQKPKAPAVQPVQPRAPNVVPAQKPKAPAGQPAQPRAPNLVPAQKPKAPAVQPVQPRAPNVVPAQKPKAPAGQPAQPRAPNLVPAQKPTVFSIAYAQVSSTKNQTNAAIGTGAALKFDSIDALSGIGFISGGTEFTIYTAGAYFLIAAIQVGFGGGCASTVTSYTADYWVAVNGVAVANSNVRLVSPSTSTDVIFTQRVYIFNKLDKVTIMGSGKCSISIAINPGGSEPLIPSIIATLYKID